MTFEVGDPVTCMHETRWLVGTVTAVHESRLDVLIATQETVPAIVWSVPLEAAFKLVPEGTRPPDDLELFETPRLDDYTPAALRALAAALRAQSRTAALSLREHDASMRQTTDPKIRMMAGARKHLAYCQTQRSRQWADMLETTANEVEDE